MSIAEIIALAVALSVDASICAVVYGNRNYEGMHRLALALAFAAAFGGFQFIMPLLGSIGGKVVDALVGGWDKWIAFALLAWVSYGMIREGLSGSEQAKRLNALILLMLAVATSIDALAVGVSAALVQADILLCATIIGITCALITLVSFLAGQVLSTIPALSRISNFLGALVLLSIGLINLTIG